MSTKNKGAGQDRHVLELKISAVNEHIKLYEEKTKELDNVINVEVIKTEQTADGERLEQVLLQCMSTIASIGSHTSLIEKDLAEIKVQLGTQWNEKTTATYQTIQARGGAMLELPHSNSTDNRRWSEARLLANDIVAFLNDGLEPARLLRERYIEQLSTLSTNLPGTTSGKQLRKRRDQRIRALKKLHPDKSPRQIAVMAATDPILMGLLDKVRISRHIVREAFRGRKQNR
jgi:hypothetical protein